MLSEKKQKNLQEFLENFVGETLEKSLNEVTVQSLKVSMRNVGIICIRLFSVLPEESVVEFLKQYLKRFLQKAAINLLKF